jgi:SAM-dependent methyltransferase
MLSVVSGTPSRRSGDHTAPAASSYWDGISEGIAGRYYHDAVIGRIKREAHLRLIARWCGDLSGKVVLKTDLFEEAHGTDQFLFELTEDAVRVGVDIAPLIARRAAQQANVAGTDPPSLLAGDVLALPFRTGAFDVIVSNSTLDHFPERRLIDGALGELHRVLKPGGVLVVTFDNPRSLSYLAGRVKRLLRPDPFYLGHTLSRPALTGTLVRLGYRVTDTTAIIHGLENHSSAVMWAAGRIGGHRLPAAIGKVLGALERLEAAPTRYLTGAFVAARAVKVERGRTE